MSKADDENRTDGHDAAGTTTIFQSASILKFCFDCLVEKKQMIENVEKVWRIDFWRFDSTTHFETTNISI
jgi:hypothetical protein